MDLNKTVKYISFAIIGFIAFQVYSDKAKKRNEVQKTNVAISQNTSESKKIKSDNQIGGDFALIDTNYETVKSDKFSDKYKLLYFGFTNCPDICPTDMARISTALNQIDGGKLENIQPIFITIDPERDDPQSIKSYISSFHPSFIGLTGTKEEIADVANKYKIYYKKAESEDLDEYLMDHSAYVYLIDKEGNYVKHFTNQQTAEDIANSISEYL